MLGEEAVLLVAWSVRLSLEQQCLTASPDFASQLLGPGDGLDLLRSQASAAPKDYPRIGLPVQPFFWSLALSMVALVNTQRREASGCELVASSFLVACSLTVRDDG